MPLTLKDANAVVAAWHRHHKPVTAHRFSLGAVDDTGAVRGVAIVGRPVARMTDAARVAEVLRVATDGTRNACSLLLGAAARTAKGMGFESIQTFTLPVEGGASLRGAGWVLVGGAGGGAWGRPSRARVDAAPTAVKSKWVRQLNPPRPGVVMPEVTREPVMQTEMFQ